MPQLNKKLKASRKKGLIMSRKTNTQIYKQENSPLLQIADLDAKMAK